MKKIILILTLILLSTSLLAENHMDLIYEFEGENPGDKFGRSMCSLDFNGDGLDDLVVGTPFYGVGGKVYFYLGGDDFGGQPSFIMTGNSDNRIDVQVRALGDLNNDGYDDIVIPNYNRNISSFEFWILLGGAEPDTIPDYIYLPGGEPLSMLPRFNALGDVNNDGYDDAGIATRLNQYYILWGGNTLELELFYEDGVNNYNGMNISGIGDVNSDGYDDIQIGYVYYSDQIHYYYKNLLFYGENPPDSIPDLVLVDTLFSCGLGGMGCGDWNNDGYDDFFSYDGTSIGFWLGGEEITSQPDIYMEAGGIGMFGQYDYGDFNNDGYSDAAFGFPIYCLNDGRVYIALGGSVLNGSYDLYLDAPEISNNFGQSVAVGDFNNDGYDDVAVGAPGSGASPDIYPGKVYIYAGNDSLAETSVGVDDPDWSGEITNYELMNVYPNPFSSEINFEIKAQYLNDLQVQIYNVRGQLVETINVKNRSFVWKAKQTTSGVYFCKLVHKNKVLEVKKVTLVK
jgi:hypothetical protein